jgi:signal transduction histidine kinase
LNQYLYQIEFPFLQKNAKRSFPFPLEHMIKLKRFGNNIENLAEEVPKWLREYVFTRNFIPSLSSGLAKKIIQNLWEIINNAMQHSKSKYGISCCGQFYPQCGYFEIAFSDFGIGIPGSVKKFNKKYADLSDIDCIRWSIQKGTTTRPEIESGGLGLYYLTEFLKLNKGCLQIVSHQGMFQLENTQEKDPTIIRNTVIGTLFNLRIIYDDNLYYLEGERLK